MQILIFIITNLDGIFSRFLGITESPPDLIIISIYYWSFYKIEYFPIWFLILLSIYNDFIIGMPISPTCTMNLMLYQIIIMNKNILSNKSFKLVWMYFSFFTFLIMIIKHIFISLISQKIFTIEFVLMQYIFTILLYPLMHHLYNKLLNSLN